MPTQTRPKFRIILISALALMIASCVVTIILLPILLLAYHIFDIDVESIGRLLNMALNFVFAAALLLVGMLLLLFPKAATPRDAEQEFFLPLGRLYWWVKSFLGLAIVFMASSIVFEIIVEELLETTGPYYEPLSYLMSFLGFTCFIILGALMLLFPKHITQVAMNLLPTRITNRINLNPNRRAWGIIRFGVALLLIWVLILLYFVITRNQSLPIKSASICG